VDIAKAIRLNMNSRIINMESIFEFLILKNQEKVLVALYAMED
jgi:hypothetical protein